MYTIQVDTVKGAPAWEQNKTFKVHYSFSYQIAGFNLLQLSSLTHQRKPWQATSLWFYC